MKPDAVSVGRLKAEHKPFADSRLILCTGNLYWIKGYNHMLEAMSRLRIRYPHLRLVLIGRGEDETSLKNLAEQLGLKDSVMFAGYRMNVPDWLSVADIYCQPSLVDAMPRALLEAMYMSLPVVVSDIENLKEAVKNQENGLVVKAGSPAALAEAIEYLINNMDDARRMGSNARIFVEQKCSMDVMAKRIIDEI
jgi:glycosyltransferase involved in cell wall biosynthesis